MSGFTICGPFSSEYLCPVHPIVPDVLPLLLRELLVEHFT